MECEDSSKREDDEVPMRDDDHDLLDEIFEPMIEKGRKAVLRIYGKSEVSDLEGEWVGYHLLKYATFVRDKSRTIEKRLKASLTTNKAGDFTDVQKMLSETTISVKRSKAIFSSLAQAQSIPLIVCLVEFLDYCKKKKWPLIRFKERIKRKNVSPETVEYTELDLIKTSNDIRKYIREYSPASIKKSGLPLTEPRWILRKPEQNKGKAEAKGNDSYELSLNPNDHHSIPLFGRENQIKDLNGFLNAEARFLMIPIIGPSGAGKTRLISEWLHKHVNKTQWPEAGLLETTTKKVWKNWSPTCNTLIIIDYIYRFNDIINLIIERSERSTEHSIRLVILDHVFPEELRDLERDHFHKKSYGESSEKLEFREPFFHPTLFLEQVNNRSSILLKIIAHTSGKPETNREVKSALEVIQPLVLEGFDDAGSREKSATAHPLFAALIGQAIREGKENISHWKRQDLIGHYLNTKNRLPWKPQKKKKKTDTVGCWVGAFVAAATVRRGMPFEALAHSVPEELSGDDRSAITGWCSRIVSSSRTAWLKPFEPDILGENFFLMFFEYYLTAPSVQSVFIRMICAEDIPSSDENSKPYDIAEKYIEFTQRLARNLANDDRDTEYVKEAWRTLARFLDPNLYPKESPLRLAVSIAIAKVSDVLQDNKLDNLNVLFFKRINDDDLVAATDGELFQSATEAFTKYFDRCGEKERKKKVFRGKLFEVLGNHERQNTSRPEALHLACYHGCFNVVKILVCEQYVDLYAVASGGWSALHMAAYGDHADIVGLLAQKANNVDFTNNNGFTALMMASYEGHVDVSGLLAEKTKDVDLTNDDGTTALMLASSKGHAEVVGLLAEKTKNVDLTNNQGFTALMIAIYEGHVDVASLLVGKTKDVDLTKNKGTTALMLASSKGHADVVGLLAEKTNDIDLINNEGWTALMLASRNGHMGIADLLAEKTKDVDLINNYGFTALMLASQNGHMDIAGLLAEKTKDVDLTNDSGTTALMLASSKGHVGIAGLLAEKTKDVDLTNDDGTTALMFASQSGHVDVVGLLAEKTKDVDLTENNSWSALMLASQNGHVDVADLLVGKTKDVDLINNNGLTALMLASQNGHLDVAALLAKKTKDVDLTENNSWTALMLASQNGHVDVADLLAEKTKDVDLTQNDGWTALMLASRYGHGGVVALLAEKTKDVDLTNNSGFTALMLASHLGIIEVAESLIRNGAIIGASGKGITALMVAGIDGEIADGPTFLKNCNEDLFVFPDSFGPLFPGNWKNLDRDDLKAFSERLIQSKYRFIMLKVELLGIRSIKPSFYPDGEIYECLFYTGNSTENRYFCAEAENYCSLIVLEMDDSFYLIGGLGNAILDLNRLEKLVLSQVTVLEYLRFFCNTFENSSRVFKLMITDNDMPFLPAQTMHHGPIPSFLKPKISEQVDGNFSILECSVLYGSDLFRAEFVVSADGTVEMHKNIPVAAKLPVRSECFKDGMRLFAVADSLLV